MRRLSTLVVLCVLTVGLQAEAALITYSNQATFLADTGASSATGLLPDAGAVAPGFTVGSVSFTTLSGQLFIGTGGLFPTQVTDWSTTLPGNDIAISGVESFRVDLAAPVYSLGFDFFEPNQFSTAYPVTNDCFAPCFDSTFQVSLFLGGSPVGSFSYNAPDATLAFVGVWADQQFDRAEIIDVTNTIDDEYWGQFYTGATSPVPEPATVLLFASGVGALASRRRRRS
jgi:hypothetical protein